MNRPYTICYMMVSLEGNIDGDHWKLPEAQPAWGSYREGWKGIDPDATIYGAVMVSEFASSDWLKPEDLPKASKVYPREDYVAPSDIKKYYIVVNTKGTLSYESKYVERKNRGPHAVIHVLTENVSDDYLEYLRGKEISYIFCGKETLDPVIMMQKAYSLFGIKKAVAGGGGYTNWSLLTAGVIDEVQTVYLPVADGDPNSHAAFQRMDGMESRPVPFQLIGAKPVDGEGLLVTYKPKNALPND